MELNQASTIQCLQRFSETASTRAEWNILYFFLLRYSPFKFFISSILQFQIFPPLGICFTFCVHLASSSFQDLKLNCLLGLIYMMLEGYVSGFQMMSNLMFISPYL